jgi:hypothetical protein
MVYSQHKQKDLEDVGNLVSSQISEDVCEEDSIISTSNNSGRTDDSMPGESESLLEDDLSEDTEDSTERSAADDDLLEGGTLVVCPTSVLHQWHRELTEKACLPGPS